MIVYSFLSLIALGAFVYMGTYIYTMDPRKPLNRFLVLVCVCFVLWSLARFVQFLIYPQTDVTWSRISSIGSGLFASFFLHSVLLWTGKSKLLGTKWIYVFLYFPSTFFILSAIIVSPATPLWEKRITLLFFYHLAFSFIALFIILRWGKRAELRREKKQAQIVFRSGIATMGLMVLNIIYAKVLPEQDIPTVPHLAALTVVWGIWHCMVKYKFLDAASLISANHLLDHVMDMVVVTDPSGSIQRVNRRVTDLLGYKAEELLGRSILKILLLDGSADFCESIRAGMFPKQIEYLSKGGNRIPAKVMMTPLKDILGDVAGIVFIGQDIRLVNQLEQEVRDRIRAEERLSYISMHDPLTGLYNRTWFEMEIDEIKQKKPDSIGLILCDLDGLKLINDTMGHASGDKLLIITAQLLRNAYTEGERISRIGGDEFAILLTGCTKDQILKIVGRIHEDIRVHNEGRSRVPLSISVGYSFSEDGSIGIEQIFKEADNNMYKAKLNNKMSSRNAVVKALEGTLAARDPVMDDHAARIETWVIELAKRIGMQEHELADIRLFARFHDIGKVGIPDRILLKEGPLTEEEYAEMKRHSEIGFHIAQSTPDLTHIALWILKHHEWWNGKGYPLGLAGENIPVQCRIISIVDAFDAMTNDRTYRKAMSGEQALEELVRCSGSQFDPNLTGLFVHLILEGGSVIRSNRSAADG